MATTEETITKLEAAIDKVHEELLVGGAIVEYTTPGGRTVKTNPEQALRVLQRQLRHYREELSRTSGRQVRRIGFGGSV